MKSKSHFFEILSTTGAQGSVHHRFGYFTHQSPNGLIFFLCGSFARLKCISYRLNRICVAFSNGKRRNTLSRNVRRPVVVKKRCYFFESTPHLFQLSCPCAESSIIGASLTDKALMLFTVLFFNLFLFDHLLSKAARAINPLFRLALLFDCSFRTQLCSSA